MSELSPSTAVPPLLRAETWPWWLPGTLVGFLTAVVVFVVAQLTAATEGSHKVQAFVQYVSDEPPPPWLVQQRRFFIRNPDLLARVVADPVVAELAIIKGWADPVVELERRLVVEEIAPNVLEVSITSDSPGDVKTFLDHLVKRFVADSNTLDNKAHDDRRMALERQKATVQQELDIQERLIEVETRFQGRSDDGPSVRLREQRNGAQKQLVQGHRDLELLSARLAALRAPVAAPKPDPIEVARAVNADPRVAPLLALRAEAVVALEREKVGAANLTKTKELQGKVNEAEKALAAAQVLVRSEVEMLLSAAEASRAEREVAGLEQQIRIAKGANEAIQRERDAIQKVLDNVAQGVASAGALRDALAPQRQLLTQIQMRLLELQLTGDRARVVARGEATVSPLNTGPRHLRAVLLATVAFVGGLVVTTGFQLTGLSFRLLRRFV